MRAQETGSPSGRRSSGSQQPRPALRNPVLLHRAFAAVLLVGGIVFLRYASLNLEKITPHHGRLLTFHDGPKPAPAPKGDAKQGSSGGGGGGSSSSPVEPLEQPGFTGGQLQKRRAGRDLRLAAAAA
jgi:hypothetical protein